MNPTDDEIVSATLRAMMALESDIDRAIHEESRPKPARASFERVRSKDLHVFGTSAWDDDPRGNA